MNTDFALRKDFDGQIGMVNVLHSTYKLPHSSVTNRSFVLPEMQHQAKPMKVTLPKKELLNTIQVKEPDINPEFRKKYKLPKKQSSIWFDQAAYTSYP